MVLGTLVDLIETLKFSNSSRSISSTNSTAAVTSASTEFSRSSSCRCLGSEPEFTPMRMGTPASLALAATSATLSGPPMLPGLSRMQWAPASIDLRARVWLKWMSAITGIGDCSTIVLRASTSLSRGTAQRTRSPPASAIAWIWRIVASRSAVSVLVIDCTATGAPPPIGTSPTMIWRLEGTTHKGIGRPIDDPRLSRRSDDGMAGAEHALRVDLRPDSPEAVVGAGPEGAGSVSWSIGQIEVVAARAPRLYGLHHTIQMRVDGGRHLGE